MSRQAKSFRNIWYAFGLFIMISMQIEGKFYIADDGIAAGFAVLSESIRSQLEIFYNEERNREWERENNLIQIDFGAMQARATFDIESLLLMAVSIVWQLCRVSFVYTRATQKCQTTHNMHCKCSRIGIAFLLSLVLTSYSRIAEQLFVW